MEVVDESAGEAVALAASTSVEAVDPGRRRAEEEDAAAVDPAEERSVFCASDDAEEEEEEEEEARGDEAAVEASDSGVELSPLSFAFAWRRSACWASAYSFAFWLADIAAGGSLAFARDPPVPPDFCGKLLVESLRPRLRLARLASFVIERFEPMGERGGDDCGFFFFPLPLPAPPPLVTLRLSTLDVMITISRRWFKMLSGMLRPLLLDPPPEEECLVEDFAAVATAAAAAVELNGFLLVAAAAPVPAITRTGPSSPFRLRASSKPRRSACRFAQCCSAADGAAGCGGAP